MQQDLPENWQADLERINEQMRQAERRRVLRRTASYVEQRRWVQHRAPASPQAGENHPAQSEPGAGPTGKT